MSAAAAPAHNSDVFDLWAQVYDEQINPLLALEKRFLTQLLPPVRGLHVLDAGCGTGRWLGELASHSPESLTGVDVSPGMLEHAAIRCPAARLHLGSCIALPVQNAGIDLALASFLLSYVPDLEVFAEEVSRVLRPGATVFLSDVHPQTVYLRNWKRAFTTVAGKSIELATWPHSLEEIIRCFESSGFITRVLLESCFGSPERPLFERAGKLAAFHGAEELPAIYILQLQKSIRQQHNTTLSLAGARCALSAAESVPASVTIEDRCIADIGVTHAEAAGSLDLSGYLLLPGLINAHDHLEFALFPRLGHGPYENSAQWAADIHSNDAATIKLHRSVPKEARLWWGGIRNLLCGVTTVCHHNPLSPELLHPDFPVRVVSNFSWAHSLALDNDAEQKFHYAPPYLPFILHAAEGIDETSEQEVFELDQMRMLDERTMLVHGLALTPEAVELLNQRGVTLVLCSTSNQFLFQQHLSHEKVESVHKVVLGSDSPLTAAGDLLDEISFAHTQLGLDAAALYEMVTTRSAKSLRLHEGEGSIRPGAIADLIAVRDTGLGPAETLTRTASEHIELVILGGRVQLASQTIFERLPPELRDGLQPLEVDGQIRWVRAPLDFLFEAAEKVLGKNMLRLGGKRVHRVHAA